MRGQINKWGNSAALRLPRDVLARAGMGLDHAVDIEAREGEIVITAVIEPEYTIDSLLEASPPQAFELDNEDRAWLDDEPRGRELV
jgi:antitoxin component of MazEF toxin-antitoxin module